MADSDREHAYIPKLKQQFAEGKVDRREFVRTATLLGLSASAAYGFVGKVTGEAFVKPAKAAMPKGGTVRIGMGLPDIKNPHAFDVGEDSTVARQVVEYLSKTGHDNVTRPYLLERWEPSDDLKTWTLHVRKGIKWHNGRAFTADDVVWNIRHILEPETGSSVIGLMKAYMLEEYETGEKDEEGNAKKSTRLWDANAIEKVDDHTVRLNCKMPQLAVPEHFFHYPFSMLDPEENGFFGPGSNGTGPFDLVEYQTTQKAVHEARNDYWGENAHIDRLKFIDLGEDPTAAIGALASKQVHGLYAANSLQLDALKQMPHLQMYDVGTATTVLVRGKFNQKPHNDPRVRKALRLAVDQNEVLQVALRGRGLVGEHHHVCPIHPEYAKLPMFNRDVDAAKRLLVEAGYPDGLDLKITCPQNPPWNPDAVQVMVEHWKAANIRVTIKLLPTQQFWDVWDKSPFGATYWWHRPLGVMVLGLAYRSGVPWNESGYSNPEFDKLLAKAEGTVDVEERREVMVELEKILQEDGPLVQPIWVGGFTFYDKRVKGFKMHPTNYVFGNQLAIES